MREILFRGKRTDNGEWVEGHLVETKCPCYNCIIIPFINVDFNSNFSDILDVKMCAVKPETVGQFTGLTFNGTKIFEGDICRVGNLLYKVEFKYSAWQFTILSNKVHCSPGFNSSCCEYCEIIGNIHDNPELLEDTK